MINFTDPHTVQAHGLVKTTSKVLPFLLRITPRKFDMVPTCDPQSPAHTAPDLRTHSNLTLSKRGTRTSFTFRKIRHEPCRCGENLLRLLPAALQ